MYSPKLYDVKKVPYQRLKQSGFRLEEVGEPSYTVSQQDNMLFRQIRLITQEDGIRNPYIVFVDCKNAKNDPEGLHMLIQNGFHVGERHFKISESSASMTRNGILSFVDSTIYDELNRRVSMGCDIKYTVLSKWYAYRGLMLSACHLLPEWRPKVIVVPDYMQTLPRQKIKSVYDKEIAFTDKEGRERIWRQKDIQENCADITVNTFDGCGIHHPDITEVLQNKLHTKHRPTTILWRAPFIKGVTHEMDYTSFWQERGVTKINDIWGVAHDIREPMIILTESMYKGMGYFAHYGDARDWTDYWSRFEQYHHCIGVAKYNFSKEEEAVYTRVNYQILQDLELPYSEFATLAEESIRWLERIMEGDRLYTYCFLGLTEGKEKVENNYMKALLKNPEMLKEPSIRKYFVAQVQKYRAELKCGKLWLKSCFKFLCPDLIMLLEWIGGLPISGSMEPDEFYAPGSQTVSGEEYLIERNPHICKSEHTILKAAHSGMLQRYCGHLENVCLVNSKSLTPQRLNGADFDGDLVLLIDNKTMLRGVNRSAAIVLDIEDKATALEEENTLENRARLIERTLHSLIGETSNCATAYHNKMPKSTEQKRKYEGYVDLLSVINGKAIDFAKTGVLFHIPRHIAKYGKPLPYFMKYAGEYYKRLKTFSHANSNMNRLCREIERWEKAVAWKKSGVPFDYTLMMNQTIDIPVDIEEKIETVFLAFCKEMTELAKYQAKIRNFDAHKEELQGVISREDALHFTLDWSSYYRRYRERCRSICPDERMLATIAVRLCYEAYPKKNKSFPWRVAGEGIVENIKQVPFTLPRQSDWGEAFYLGKRYTLDKKTV